MQVRDTVYDVNKTTTLGALKANQPFWALAVSNCFQVGPHRRVAGSAPAWLRIFHTALAATR